MRMRVREDDADARFLACWLQTPGVRAFVKSRASGASLAIKKIKQDDICEIAFPTIPSAEQVDWAEHLRDVEEDAGEAEALCAAKSALLDRLEQSNLERAFRGEL